MNVLKQMLTLLLLAMSVHQAVAYLDENGVPQKWWFGNFRPLFRHKLKCIVKGDWWRESAMLKAFKENDVKTFREKFRPEDCGPHPWMIEEAIANNRYELLAVMCEKKSSNGKSLNIKETYKRYVDSLSEKKEVHVQPLSYVANTHREESVALLALLRLAKFESGNGNTDAHIAAAIEPPSAGEKLVEALMGRADFDPYIPNDIGLTVIDITHAQEIRFCHPTQDGQLLTVGEIEERFHECGTIEKRKKKIISLDEKRYIKECAKRLNEKNAARSKELKEQFEQEQEALAESDAVLQKAASKKDFYEKKTEETRETIKDFEENKDKPLEEIKQIFEAKQAKT